MSEIILSTQPRSVEIPEIVDIDFWSAKRTSLRQCLNALGITDQEMRLVPGKRSILENWKREETPQLLELIKKRWKQKVIVVHEAGSNSNPKYWKMYNVIYSAILRKLKAAKRLGDIKGPSANKFIFSTCPFCKREHRVKWVSHFQHDEMNCGSPECLRAYYRQRARKYRARDKINYERYCANEKCKQRFITTNSKKHFCSRECRLDQWHRINADKIKEQSRIKHRQRLPWREWWKTLTPEEQARIRLRTNNARKRRLKRLGLKTLRAYRQKANEWHKAYRVRRKTMGKPLPIYHKYRPFEKFREEQQLKYANNPFLLETVLAKWKDNELILTGKNYFRAKLNHDFKPEIRAFLEDFYKQQNIPDRIEFWTKKYRSLMSRIRQRDSNLFLKYMEYFILRKVFNKIELDQLKIKIRTDYQKTMEEFIYGINNLT